MALSKLWISYPLMVLVVCALALVIPLLILTDIPQPDVASRYAPMAEAIAQGDMEISFHPRIPPLLPVIAGAFVWLSGCDGFWGAKAASALCFILALFPLFGLFRRIFNQRIAFWGCIIYLLCSYLLRLSASGLRETPKSLLLITATYALLLILENTKRLRGYLLLGACCGLLALVRDDCVLLALCLLCASFVVVVLRKAFPAYPIIAGLVALALVTPTLYQNYRITGYPVPSIRFIAIAEKVFPSFLHNPQPLLKKPSPQAAVTPPPPPAIAAVAPAKPTPVTAPGAIERFLRSITPASAYYFCKETVKGLYVIFTIPALFVIFRRRRTGEWNAGESLLFWMLTGHTVIEILQIAVADGQLFIERRYLLPAVPLAFGWTAIFAANIYNRIRGAENGHTLRKYLAVVTVAVSALLLYADTLAPVLRQRYSGRKGSARQAILRWVPLIRAEHPGERINEGVTLNGIIFRSWRRPVVACRDLPELGYLAGGESFWTAGNLAADLRAQPDYLAMLLPQDRQAPEFPGYELVEVFTNRGYSYALWRRRK